jgi:hypothetical protein
LKKYKEVIERYPFCTLEYQLALLKLKRYNDVLNLKEKNSMTYYTYAACKLNKFELPLKKYDECRDVRFFVKSYQAIQEYFYGNREKALIQLKQLNKLEIDTPNLRVQGMYIELFYFYGIPMILDINNNKGKEYLKEKLKHVKQKYRYVKFQTFYYLLSYLTGEISEKEFLAQPLQAKLELQTIIYNIIEAEYHKNSKKALQLYKKLLDAPFYIEYSLFGIFAIERIKEIEKQLNAKRHNP